MVSNGLIKKKEIIEPSCFPILKFWIPIVLMICFVKFCYRLCIPHIVSWKLSVEIINLNLKECQSVGIMCMWACMCIYICTHTHTYSKLILNDWFWYTTSVVWEKSNGKTKSWIPANESNIWGLKKHCKRPSPRPFLPYLWSHEHLKETWAIRLELIYTKVISLSGKRYWCLKSLSNSFLHL